MSPTTLQDSLTEASTSTAGVRFVDQREQETYHSYATLASAARGTAHSLAAAGIEPGDCVAILLPTSPDFYAAFFGCLYAGAIPVPMYPPVRLGRLDEYEARTVTMLRAIDARLVLTDQRVQRLLGQVVLQSKPALGCIPLSALPEGPEAELVRGQPDEVALIQFSSGTTQAPKPVELTHRQVLANIDAISACFLAAYPESNGFEHSGVSWLPLYHDMGLIGSLLTALRRQRAMTFLPPELFVARPAAWLRAISRHRATISAAPNFAYALCAERIRDEEIQDVDLSCWLIALNGAEPVTPKALEKFQHRFSAWKLRPEALTPVYGLAEAALAVTFSEPHEPIAVSSGQPVPLGKPLPGFELRIVDDNGQACDAERAGRIQVRGPSVMRGYRGNAAATAAVLSSDRWLDTGDTGFLRDGQLCVVGRTKDLIIVRGRNIAPQDVEHAAEAAAGVRAGCTAAFGCVDEEAGEQIIVLAERSRQAEIDDDAIARSIAAQLAQASGLVAAKIDVLEPGTLPRTSSGKIRRNAARQLWLDGKLQPPKKMNIGRVALSLARSSWAMARSRH